MSIEWWNTIEQLDLNKDSVFNLDDIKDLANKNEWYNDMIEACRNLSMDEKQEVLNSVSEWISTLFESKGFDDLTNWEISIFEAYLNLFSNKKNDMAWIPHWQLKWIYLSVQSIWFNSIVSSEINSVYSAWEKNNEFYNHQEWEWNYISNSNSPMAVSYNVKSNTSVSDENWGTEEVNTESSSDLTVLNIVNHNTLDEKFEKKHYSLSVNSIEWSSENDILTDAMILLKYNSDKVVQVDTTNTESNSSVNKSISSTHVIQNVNITKVWSIWEWVSEYQVELDVYEPRNV